jgi:hypothetical protein
LPTRSVSTTGPEASLAAAGPGANFKAYLHMLFPDKRCSTKGAVASLIFGHFHYTLKFLRTWYFEKIGILEFKSEPQTASWSRSPGIKIRILKHKNRGLPIISIVARQ